MKKRLFISSILMTLVLLVAITTATFAWYSASTAAGKATFSTESKAISTLGEDTYTVDGVTFSVEWGGTDFSVDTDDDTHADAYAPVDLTDGTGKVWAITNTSTKAKTEVTSQAVKKSGQGTVTVSLSTNDAGILALAAGVYTFTIQGTGQCKVNSSEAFNANAGVQIVVTITNAGAVSSAQNYTASFYYVMTGDDNIVNGSEAGNIQISMASVDYVPAP